MKKEKGPFFLSDIGECILDNSERHHRNLGAVQPRIKTFFSIVFNLKTPKLQYV